MTVRCHCTYQDSDSLGVHKTTQFNATQHIITQGQDKDKTKNKELQRHDKTRQDKTRQDKRMDKTILD